MNARSIGLGLLDAIVKIVFVVIVAMLISKYAKIAYNYGYHIFNQTAVSSGTGVAVGVAVASGVAVGVADASGVGVGVAVASAVFSSFS